MKPREQIEEALLPALRRLYPPACGRDLLFFGERADISSPLPKKNGVDIAPAVVYNILKEVALGSIPLLSDIDIEDGFLNLTVGDEALALLCGAVSSTWAQPPAETIEVDPFGREYIRARLLDIFHERGGAFSVPEEPLMRRAFWNVLAADSPASLSVALRRCGAALAADRKSRLLSGAAALIMASALQNK